MRQLLLGLFVIAVLVAGAQGDDFSHFKITKQRSADVVSVTREQGVTVFNVSSSNGIGWAKIENDKAWPMKAIVRLSYQGDRPWKHLEGFTIASTRANIASSLSGGLEVRPITEKGRQALKGLSKEELAERVGFECRVVDHAIEIELPMTWLAEERTFTIRWIDFYRS